MEWAKFVGTYVCEIGTAFELGGASEHGNFITEPRTLEECDPFCIIKFYNSPVFELFRGVCFSLKGHFETKNKKLAEVMAKQPTWAGSSGMVQQFYFEDSLLFCLDKVFKGVKLLDGGDGGRAWTRAFRGNTRNCGGMTGMCPGMAGIFFSFVSSFQVVLASLTELDNVGIGIDAYEAFAGSAEGTRGGKWMKEHAVVVDMKPGQFLYMPGGYFFHILSYEKPPKHAKPDWKADLYFVNHVPVLVPPTNLPIEITTAIVKHNHSTFAVKDMVMWTERKTVFDSVFASKADEEQKV